MKKAVLLHGTDGNTNELWWPWVKAKLEDLEYEYFAPLLPDNHTPNRVTYAKFLKTADWDYKGNLLIGHSSGATTILNLLYEDWFPTVKTVVLFGAFLDENLVRSAEWYDPGQFDNLFLPEYSANKIAHKASSFYFVHGDNDPYCSYEDAKDLCKRLGGKFITINNGHHLAGTSGITEFPEVFELLIKDNAI